MNYVIQHAIRPADTGVWVPTAIGAAVGLTTATFSRHRKSPNEATLGALVGGALGLGCGLVWSSRQKIAAWRDARWLARHPIDYA